MGICHKTWAWSTDYRFITVDARDQRRIAAHLEHGDTVNPDFSSDPNHCGACGNACIAPANGSAYCNGGSCEFSCEGGYEWNGSACVEITARLDVTMGPSDGTFCLVTLTLVDGRPGMRVNVRVETSTIGFFIPTFNVDDGYVQDSGLVPVGATFPGGTATLVDSDGNPIVGLPVDLPTTACGAS